MLFGGNGACVTMLPNLGKVAETLRKSSEIREQTALMCKSSALQKPFGNFDVFLLIQE
jgi:hypothetical protein